LSKDSKLDIIPSVEDQNLRDIVVKNERGFIERFFDTMIEPDEAFNRFLNLNEYEGEENAL
jgi:hypothetical protein